MSRIQKRILQLLLILGIGHLAISLHGQQGDDVKISSDNWQIQCDDGLEIQGVVDLPKGRNAQEIERVIILVHGSGSHSMDVDLTVVTHQRQENLLFKTIGRSLAREDFAVIRYNKRNYQIVQWMKDEEKKEAAKELAKTLRENPLKCFVEDVKSIVSKASVDFPNAEIYLLGHSEGTYVSLQAADQMEKVAGVGLIGFAEYSTSTLAFTQTVYRPLYLFEKLDLDSNDELSEDELKAEDPLATALRTSMKIVDQDGNGKLSQTEFQAANLANLLVADAFAPFRKQEAIYPRVAEILKRSKFKVAFFQGMLDNQTPAYHAMAVQLLMKQMQKDQNMFFQFFEGLGHALDKRSDYSDVEFRRIDAEALNQMTTKLDAFFPKKEK